MGAVHFSIDLKLVDELARHLPFEVFVETGTYKGGTVELVKPYFSRLFSIELSDHFAKLAQSRFLNDAMVTILHGDAGVELKTLITEIEDKSALFWLDSHWCDDSNVEGAASQCSLMKELLSIGQLNSQSVILIDDARLFLSPPGKPHDYSQWPDINDVLSALRSLSAFHECLIINDIIAYFPKEIKTHVKQYAHQNGIDWLHAMDVFRQYDGLISEMKVKENEIESIKRENVVLTKEIEIKEKEIRIKEQEIHNVNEVAQHRLYVINQFEETRKSIAGAYSGQIEGLKGQVAEIQSRLETLKELTQEKDNQIGNLKDIAESRLKVIQDLDSALKAYQQRRIRERLRMWLRPRIGVLYHYPPRPLKIPDSYLKHKNKSIDSQTLPLICMVTPSFNHGDYIEKTMISVFEQKYPKLHYVIQDGGSDDGTVEILKKYDNRLKHWESKKDNGQADAINQGFSDCPGDIMSYLNSDDILLPGALYYVADYFETHPDVDVVYGHRILIDEYDQEIGRWVLPQHDDAVLSWADFIPQETMFWKRSIWDKSGGYINNEFNFAMDWDLILRFRSAGAKFVRLPRFLGAFRVHPHQKTSKEIADQGEKEMKLLRERAIGRSVSEAEINLNLKKYMSRHIMLHKLYRAGILRY